MRTLFTICGRAGSKGVKNKNIRCMNGIPLPYYTLAAIALYREKHPEIEVEVALNTDSEELKKFVLSQQIITDIHLVDRREELAGDRAAKVNAIQDCFLFCREKKQYDVIIDLDLTSPMRRLRDIEAAVEQLFVNTGTDLVFSVVPARRNPYFNMVEQEGKYYKKIVEASYTARQQAPRIFEMNASIYAYHPTFLSLAVDRTILDYRCRIVEMEDYLVLDIDSEKDFELMSFLIKYFAARDPELAQVVEAAGKMMISMQKQSI